MQDEIWRPGKTKNWEDFDHEVSSRGRVRNKKTGEFLELHNTSGPSPHYCINGLWWRPDILVGFIFADLLPEQTPKRASLDVPRRKEKTKWHGVIDSASITPKPKKPAQPTGIRRPRVIAPVVSQVPQPKAEVETAMSEGRSEWQQQETSEAERALMELVEAQPDNDPLVELAQTLYRPYKSRERVERTEADVTMDTSAQKMVSTRNKSKSVYGVAHVLKLHKDSAVKRGYEWRLSDEQAIYLMITHCHYCGCEPGTHNQNGLNGIDRVDSGQGYTDENVVPCCGKCNLMKGTKSPDEFLRHAVEIAEYQKVKQVTS